jgi:hypothetical protein
MTNLKATANSNNDNNSTNDDGGYVLKPVNREVIVTLSLLP